MVLVSFLMLLSRYTAWCLVLILQSASLKMIMESSKKGRCVIPFKKFS